MYIFFLLAWVDQAAKRIVCATRREAALIRFIGEACLGRAELELQASARFPLTILSFGGARTQMQARA